MIVTTTPSVDGRAIAEYLGIVTGEAILGANVFKDVFAGIRDIVGGRAAAYERELKRARDIAFNEMEAEATSRGGDAVVAVDLDYETIAARCSWSAPAAQPFAWRPRSRRDRTKRASEDRPATRPARRPGAPIPPPRLDRQPRRSRRSLTLGSSDSTALGGPAQTRRPLIPTMPFGGIRSGRHVSSSRQSGCLAIVSAKFGERFSVERYL